MMKKISLIVFVASSLCAQSFDTFLNSAIHNSPYLKSSHLGVTQATLQGEILTRYSNPELSLEYARFQEDSSSDNNGFSIDITQPLRLWGINRDKHNLATEQVHTERSRYTLSKAQFIRDLSLEYTLYARLKKQLELGNEELRIAQHIFDISQQRYLAGTVSHGVMLQAQVDYEMVAVKIETLHLNALEQYYALLRHAGMTEETPLEYTHQFTVSAETHNTNHPELRYLQHQSRQAQAAAEVNTHAIEWTTLHAGYDREPGQDIVRMGASIPLALFNTRSQERQIALLEAERSTLLAQNSQAKLTIEHKRLQQQRHLLLRLKEQHNKTLKTQTTLLSMFEDAYKIARINLLELQNIKNRLIMTKEHLIQTETALHQNAIYTNYIAGAYND